LFDIGIAGPIAGFLVAVAVLFFALPASKPLTVDTQGIVLGFPWIFKLAHGFLAVAGNRLVANFPLDKLCLHPTAFAAWFGMFATALNLLPGGQLDGGHIVFALRPRAHRAISMLTVLVLLPLSLFYWSGWLLWAVILRLTGGRHPNVPLTHGLSRKRWFLAAFALLMLLLTVTPLPFPGDKGEGSGFIQLLEEWRHPQEPPSKQ
jgi:membrane-associated protease RseP (regulator of RpoE activity)